jgi:hypothetical protein
MNPQELSLEVRVELNNLRRQNMNLQYQLMAPMMQKLNDEAKELEAEIASAAQPKSE